MDGGNSWSTVERTDLPNPDSAIAALSVSHDLHLLAYNRSRNERTPLVLATSPDGYRWNDRAVIENEVGEFSYPSLCCSTDGVVMSYTVNRTSIACVWVPLDEFR